MIKFHRILLLTLVAVFLASAAGIARYAADSCTQSRMYRQLAAQTENFPDDTVSTGNDFLPQYQALYAQNSDLAGWIQIDGTNINYPVMQSKHDPDFYLKHNFEKADSPHGCPYVQANCDLQTPSDNILVYGHNMKDGTMFSDLLQYKREFFWEQHRIIRFDTLTAQAEYTVMAVFRGEAEDLFAYYQFADAETPQEFAAYVDACKNAALYETGVTAAYGDKLLTLSTCDDSGKNSRMPALPKEHRWCSQAEKGNGTACTLQKIFWTWIISRNFPGMIAAAFVCRSPAREIAFCVRIAAISSICGIP